MRFILVFLLTLLPLMTPELASAQGAATLVADTVFVPAGGQQLIAEGNVEVFFDGTRLSARRITFDQVADQLTIDGPVFIVTRDGTILTADTASLDPQLENGILRGARLVLDQQLQLSATQADRVDGRYTQLYQVAATSCHICANGETPLWEIRARRIIHDQGERQLYFDDAAFHVAGVPIFYIPRMRLPDPTLTRATGLLIPSLKSSETLGTGFKLPYFIKLGDHRDLTLTPYLSTSTTTLESAYRQAFLRSNISIEAAVTNDDLMDAPRAYVFANGIFDLGSDITLRFDVEVTSDDAYLLEYGYSGKDRLDSEIALQRVRDRYLTQASLTHHASLRTGEDSATLPPLLTDISWERRVTPSWGGTLTLTSDQQSHYRTTDAPRTTPKDMAGRDVARIGIGAAWRGDRIMGSGLVVDGTFGADLDYYDISDDTLVGDTLRSTIYGQTTLRYPLIRQGSGATHVLEPFLQLAWAGVQGGAVTNEDSTATEFDQANLLALSHFSGEDAVETGLRGAAGLSWTRIGAGGWDSTMTVGRVSRDAPDLNFSLTSGLREAVSDWLIAGQLRTPAGFAIDSRLLLNDSFDVTKSEARVGWNSRKLDLAASYIFLPADMDESRPSSVSEWTIDTTYRFDQIWSMGLDARYDVMANAPTSTGLQIGWQNECVTVDFSVSRRFTTSTTLTPSTDFGLSVGLNGFSAGRTFDAASHRCTN
ncbi:putative organic solvent tolerance family protein [Octadecabacter antarcticus 307]|uniref:LPS-assembly protein LptD n=1 Tax=Octadecabacter antarcticus 307 TaxID=391626 RepID=M9RD05_9RHOB|nr:LPS assembly protein LptD [Octadecabacter antarcticus]AGI68296.1 putative organic solvent tolerance family protein [Octadecabacter antarcticus 307]